MAWIKKRAGKFQVGWRDLAGEECFWTCPTARDAKIVKLDVETARGQGRDWKPEGSGQVDLISTVAAAYVDEVKGIRAGTTATRYATSLDVFARFLRQEHPKGTLGVSLLARPTLADFASWLRKGVNGLHGRARGSEAVRKMVEVVELLWKWAENAERWDGIGRPRTLGLPRRKPQRVSAPTWAEVDNMIGKCSGWQRQLVTWLRYTGLRVGESMMILWSDIDLDRGVVTIRPEINKTEDGRVVPLSPHVVEVISTWGKREGYLIPSGRREGSRQRQVRARDISRAWERAGVRQEVWLHRPDHAIRKAFKTGMLALGAHPDAIDFLQGHEAGDARSRYIDAWQALPLVAVAKMIPKIGGTDENVAHLPTVADGAAGAVKVRSAQTSRSSK